MQWILEDQQQLLAERLAAAVARDLDSALASAGTATLAVSGGSTPKPFFAALSRAELDWSRVVVTLVDERWVDGSHDDSNARLVREYLLCDRAAAAQFIDLKVDGDDVYTAEAACATALLPFVDGIDVVVLGMGADGHTASFFPGADELAAALDPDSPRLCLGVRPPEAPHDRMTLSLSTLLRARHIYLHLTGEVKKAVLQRAERDPDAMTWPIAAVMVARPDLRTYYAP